MFNVLFHQKLYAAPIEHPKVGITKQVESGLTPSANIGCWNRNWDLVSQCVMDDYSNSRRAMYVEIHLDTKY
jgi:hypothetical protein